MCPIWYAALTSKCTCQVIGVALKLHSPSCDYRIKHEQLLEQYHDLVDNETYREWVLDLIEEV